MVTPNFQATPLLGHSLGHKEPKLCLIAQAIANPPSFT